jgi:hypothetical protein
MKKYGSFVLAAIFISSMAFADIPVVHQDHSKHLREEVINSGAGTAMGEDGVKLCRGAALEHCQVGVGCKLTCPKDEAANKSSNRGTAAVKGAAPTINIGQ